jgi:hypothetical protein
MSDIKAIIAQFSSDLEAAIRAEVARQLLAAAGVQGAVAKGASPRVAKAAAKAAAPKAGKRVRRSPEQLEAVQAQILKALGSKKLSSEQIQEATGLSKETLQRPLQLLRDEKRLRTSGQKRAMVYFASGK